MTRVCDSDPLFLCWKQVAFNNTYYLRPVLVTECDKGNNQTHLVTFCYIPSVLRYQELTRTGLHTRRCRQDLRHLWAQNSSNEKQSHTMNIACKLPDAIHVYESSGALRVFLHVCCRTLCVELRFIGKHLLDVILFAPQCSALLASFHSFHLMPCTSYLETPWTVLRMALALMRVKTAPDSTVLTLSQVLITAAIAAVKRVLHTHRELSTAIEKVFRICRIFAPNFQ